MDKFLTAGEVAKALKVERRTVIRWILAGKLRAFKPGGGRFWRVARADFQRFIKGSPKLRTQFKK